MSADEESLGVSVVTVLKEVNGSGVASCSVVGGAIGS